MLDSTVKRFILPFSNREESKNSFSSEVEAAAVFSIVELERKKGGGLILRQPEEKLLFIAKIGYPLWLLPRNETTFIIDGLNNSSYTLSFNEVPAIRDYMENLDRFSKTRENYNAFLSDYSSYFQESQKERKINLPGLIVDYNFQDEFFSYRKESSELTGQTLNLALLSPMIEETKISSIVNEVDNLRSFFKKEMESLPECLALLNKITSQHVTEINFEANAVRDEYNAKIKATEELVHPQIAKLNREHNYRLNNLVKNFDIEIQSLEKQKNKLRKLVGSTQSKLREYLNQARIQASRKHAYSEKKWREKSHQTKKALSELKNQMDRTQERIKNLRKQKSAEIIVLRSERDAKIKEARRPLAELEVSRDAKILVLRQETERLIKRAKPVMDRLSATAKQREAIVSKFESLGIKQDQVKSIALFYVPFYIACYQTKITERYLIISPSKIGSVDFSARLRGTLGMSKIKELLVPRFKAINALVEQIQTVIKQSSSFESQIKELAKKTNALENKNCRELIRKGLVCLKHEGWLSDKEYQALNYNFTA